MSKTIEDYLYDEGEEHLIKELETSELQVALSYLTAAMLCTPINDIFGSRWQLIVRSERLISTELETRLD